MNNATLWIVLVSGVIAAGCTTSSSEEEATGTGFIRAVHAIDDLGQVNFLIEEVTLATVDFKQVSGVSEYDDLEYDFNFDIFLPDDTDATRLITETLSVVRGTEYTFALTGTLDAPNVVLWQQTSRDWDTELDEAADAGTEVTVLEMSVGHLAASAPAVDVYVSEPGTVPVAGTALASVSFGDYVGPFEMPVDDYQVVITPAGDPATFLYASDAFGAPAAISLAVTLFDSTDPELSAYSVRLLGAGTATELIDLNAGSTLDVVHAAFNTDPVDIVLEDGFATPIVPGLVFAARSSPVELDVGERNLNITPAGDPGVFLTEEQVQISDNQRHTLYLTGLPGLLDGVLVTGSGRRLSTHARLRIYQGAARFASVDLYLAPRDGDIALLSASVPSLPYTGVTDYLTVEPDAYDIYYTEPGTKTVIAGPLPVDLEASGRYDLVTTDTAQTSLVDILFFEDAAEQ
ncbi:MAG: DUF4397 domain-containing protein [Pseudomonadota bacterium]